MKKVFLILIFILILFGCTQPEPKPAKECSSDNDCSKGFKCYNPPDCGLGVEGPTDCALKDDKCHKECLTDLDCDATEKCLNAQWSDYAFYKLCFENNL